MDLMHEFADRAGSIDVTKNVLGMESCNIRHTVTFSRAYYPRWKLCLRTHQWIYHSKLMLVETVLFLNVLGVVMLPFKAVQNAISPKYAGNKYLAPFLEAYKMYAAPSGTATVLEIRLHDDPLSPAGESGPKSV